MENFLEALCFTAAQNNRYWPYLDAHVKLWFILDKLGKV